MEYPSKRVSDEEIEKLNTRCVVGALSFLKTEATADELIECFSTSSYPKDDVQEELKRILDHGVRNGVIVINENKYTLPSRENEYHIDGDDGDDSDVEYIDPNISHYEILSSPEEGPKYKRVERTPHRSSARRSESPSPLRRSFTPSAPPPPLRTQRKRKRAEPAPTDRKTRSQTRANAVRPMAPPLAPRSVSVSAPTRTHKRLHSVVASRTRARTRNPATGKSRSPSRKRPRN